MQYTSQTKEKTKMTPDEHYWQQRKLETIPAIEVFHTTAGDWKAILVTSPVSFAFGTTKEEAVGRLALAQKIAI